MNADEQSLAIPARHNRLGEELVYRLLVELPIRRRFSRVWLKIEGPLPHPADGPAICYMNHSSWWDGYLALLLHRKLFKRSFQGFLMMDVQQLRRFRFFSWLGVFSVDRTSSAAADRSVNYIAARFRERRDRYLWLFPQGKLLPNDQRPIRLYPGLSRIVGRAGGATLFPIAFRYEFRNQQQPEIFIRCGPLHAAPADASERQIMTESQMRLSQLVDGLRDDVIHERLQGYRLLVRGAPGINHIGEALFAAARFRK